MNKILEASDKVINSLKISIINSSIKALTDLTGQQNKLIKGNIEQIELLKKEVMQIKDILENVETKLDAHIMGIDTSDMPDNNPFSDENFNDI